MKPVYKESLFLAYEQNYINQKNITLEALINHVGGALFQSMNDHRLLTSDQKVLFIIGKGNNGRDALVIASAFYRLGGTPKLLLLEDKNTYERYFEGYKKHVYEMDAFYKKTDVFDVYVDGILGINCTYLLTESYIKLIDFLNTLGGIKVSIDVPSGLKKESGIAYPVAVKADHTFIIQGHKLTNILQDAKDYQGKTYVVDCGIYPSKEVILGFYETSFRIKEIKRRINTHKYHYGHVGVVAGDLMYRGATLLCVSASLHSGAGLVSLIQDETTLNHPRQPENEVITPLLQTQESMDAAIVSKTSVVFGPGSTALTLEMKRSINLAIKAKIPCVLDAKAGLAILHERDSDLSHVVITPHVKELAEILDIDYKTVIEDPIHALELLPQSLNVILKGVVTIVKTNNTYHFIQSGNPGLAKAGTGDVLAGIIGTLIGQMPFSDALLRAVKWHGNAADFAAMKESMTCFTASSVINSLKKVIEIGE